MKSNTFKYLSILSALIFFGLYLYTVISYTNRTDVTRQKLINQHAFVISDDIWRFDSSSVKKYLRLAIESNHYKNIVVTLTGGQVFLSINNESKNRLEKALIGYDLITTKMYDANIISNKTNIGHISATVYVRNIYYYFNTFFLFISLFFIVNFTTYLQFSRRLLNQTVLARTAELQEKEEDLRTTMNSIGDAVLSTDIQGHISRANPVALDLLKSTDVETLGQSISDNLMLYDYDNKVRIHIDVPGLIEKKGVDQLNTVAFFSHPANNKIVRVAASHMYNNKNICTGLVIVISDITEMKELEHKLIQSQRMESIGLMAGGVAHDLNNILAGIVGYPELILNDLPQESELRRPIEAIMESGKRAATIVADLLTVARGAASTREVQNLNSLTQEYLDSPECKKLKSLYPNVTYQHQLEATDPNISCSPVHVKKCLMNLVTNAAEVIVNDGSVIVSTHNQSIDNAGSNEHHVDKGEYVVLCIRDTGSGISTSDLEHIFEPFYTKKVMGRSGTGLGLTVVWNTMKDHDGRIFVESSDKGTCFQLYFPVSRENGIVQKTSHKAEKLSSNRESILIIDDELQLRDLGSQMLQAIGYKVDAACSGELAIELVKKNPVDLIVLDMLMEPGMNGRQTYEEIIKLHPGQKAIITSGFSESEDVKATLQLGANDFIKKPYTLDQLAQAARKALNS